MVLVLFRSPRISLSLEVLVSSLATLGSMARLKFALIEVLVTVLIDLIECRLGVARALCDWGV